MQAENPRVYKAAVNRCMAAVGNVGEQDITIEA